MGGGDFFEFISSALRSIPNGLTPVALVSLGVATLMLTPYFRIMAAVVYYAVERDWKYVVITLSVFSLITFALLIF